MKNKLFDGKTTPYTASAKVEGGSFVRLFNKTGVVQDTIESGCVGVVDMEGGVYAASASAAFNSASKGAAIYAASGVTVTSGADFTTTSASGAVKFGYLEEDIASGTKEIKIRLD